MAHFSKLPKLIFFYFLWLTRGIATFIISSDILMEQVPVGLGLDF